MFKRFISVVVCVSLALCSCYAFSSCDRDGNNSELITVGELKQYTVIRSKDVSAELDEKISELYSSLRAKFSYAFTLADDAVENDPEAVEIVVGNCDRSECESFYLDMRADDYAYRIVGNKLLIGGGSDNATIRAIEHFLENIVTPCEKDDNAIFFDNAADAFISRAEYGAGSVTVNGTEIKDFTVVYEVGGSYEQKSAAQRLADGISDSLGFTLSVVKDTSALSGNMICVGSTVANEDYVANVNIEENDYFIGVNGESIVILSDSVYGYVCAVNSFLDSLSAKSGNGGVEIVIEDGVIAAYTDAELSAMSFNILGNARITRIIQIIDKYRPDTVGLQEDKLYGLQQIKLKLGATYEVVKHSTSKPDNEGEYCAILYNKNKLNLIESGTKWMSPTPDVPYSEFECPVEVDNPHDVMPRVFTYAVFERKSDGFRYMHVNTHLCHVLAQLREWQTEVMADFVKEYTDIPVIITGDFNSEASHMPYAILDAEGFSDSQALALVAENTGKTYLGDVVTPVDFNKVIDFCFMRDVQHIGYYSVITDKINGEYPSDHMPVYVKFELFAN